MTARSILVLLVFASTLTLRVRGIDTNFWLLRDQIRDWEIALRPFQDLPLVGPATHVGGYTIGPAFYWILWLIRVTIGPWFEYLPHAGGIGQAILQSAADALLCVALWRRTDSIPIAAATVILFATAPFDLRLSSLIWNPVMGTTLAKAATALVLLGWYRGSLLRAALLAVVAWSAVHAYTGAVFVTLGVFAVMVAGPWIEGERHTARRNLLTVVAVVALLQVPYAIYRVMEGSRNPAMGAVTHGVMRVLSGGEPPHVLESLAGYSSAVNFILVSPWTIRWSSWVLLACAGIVAFRYRRDAAVLGVVLMPQVAALAGYAFFLDPSCSASRP
jgi:hypothetical protein